MSNDLDSLIQAAGSLDADASGDAVIALQIALNQGNQGDQLAITGLFDEDTTQAVRALQHRSGVDVTGRIDSSNWPALHQALQAEHEALEEAVSFATPMPISFGTEGETVRVTDFKALIRQGPPSYRSLGTTIPYGETVDLVGDPGKYAQVHHNDETVWTSAGNLRNERNLPRSSRSSTPISLDGLSGLDRTMAAIHNDYGGYLARKSKETGYPEAGLAAVIKVESGPLGGFNLDGTPVIRFENHIFKRQLRDNALFAKHFRINNSRQVWKGHQVRYTADGPWEDFHGNQAKEHRVLALARTLNEGAALRSQSMGIVQIMGFNHVKIGYRDVVEMWNDQSVNVEPQLTAFLSFVSNTPACHRGLLASDYVTFAGGYNGSGQKERYGAWIQDAADAYARVLKGAGKSALAAAPPAATPPKPDLTAALGKVTYLRSGIDGIFGSGTARATRAFQVRHGLPADGVVNEPTQAAASFRSDRALQNGSRGEDVRAWQAWLAAQKLLDPSETDRDQVVAATKALQVLSDLTVDGIAGRNTLAALDKLV